MTELLLYLQTLDHWLSGELNSGLREVDQDKVDNLGPFAYAFGWINDAAGRKRENNANMRQLLEKTGTKLYRGAWLTEKELIAYK